ncbi:RraA family protein [Actinospica sp.]|jgi:4-hydroxy-4-methyl-2-oxoglutarate aldolase|uniref:RraA family protein n=1 Tax=Actinospica sp. TaxID=1872142 RepID=UPI002C8DCB25|nr:RraA family protein [Actinospica sp.]HWG25565.1 RraA family protein [Actinospica sp.]
MTNRTTGSGGPDERVAERIRQAASLGTATLHEAAGGVGALPSGIRRLTPGLALAGRAVTVAGPPSDNLWLHRAVYAAGPGDVLVASTGNDYEAGYWGEVLSNAARVRGLSGLVIDGCVRDSEQLTRIGVPVFGRGFCIRGTSKLADGEGSINEPLPLGDVVVRPGDLVVGDGDGVVVLPFERLDDVVDRSVARQRHEVEIISALEAGATTLALYDLPSGAYSAR